MWRLSEKQLVYRVCAAEDYPGANVNPLPELRKIQVRIEALLKLAETSDQVSLKSSLQPPKEGEPSPKRKNELAMLRKFIGLDEALMTPQRAGGRDRLDEAAERKTKTTTNHPSSYRWRCRLWPALLRNSPSYPCWPFCGWLRHWS
jgi:hypothetical protein